MKPTISAITESVTNGNVKLKFSSSEEVQVYIYWDLSPTPLPISPTNYKKYDNTDQNGTIDLGYLCTDPSIPHYYRLEIVDKAQNTYSTGTFQLGNGPGTNVTNIDKNFGLEKYYNYKTIDLGVAGTAKVNLNNGNLLIVANDFSIPGRGVPLEMNRFYNSFADYQGMIGKGWRTSFEIYLSISGQDVTIHDPDGSSHKFIYNGSGFMCSGDFRRVIRNTDQSYSVLDTNGTRYNFGVPDQNGNCRLNSIVDRFGNILNLNYDSNTGFLASVVEPSGRITALFTYDFYDRFTQRYLLSKISFTPLESGTTQSRYVSFSYQGGRLAEVRYPAIGSNLEVVVNYTYDSLPSIGLISSSRVSFMNNNEEQINSRKNETIFGYKPLKRSIGVIGTYFMDGSLRVPVNHYFDYNGDTTTTRLFINIIPTANAKV